MEKLLSQRGTVSIILAILLLSQLLVIGLGISVLMLRQIRMSGQAGLSVVAFYTAEAGAEKCLYQVRKETGEGCNSDPVAGGSITENLGEASYTADYDGANIITSIGKYRGTSRKVELTW